MKNVICYVLASVPFIVNAQSATTETIPPKEIQLKVYNLVNASRTTEAYGPNNSTYTQVSSFHIWNPTIALAKSNKRGNLHEFELTSVSINATDSRTNWYMPNHNINVITSGSKVFETHIALRYEHILNLVKKPGAKLIPSIGFAASPYYLRYNLVPYVTTTYPTKETFIGARVFATPRINYNMGRRLFIDLNIPVCLADINYNNHREQNPTVATQQQSVTTTNFTAIPKYFSARLGVGLRL